MLFAFVATHLANHAVGLVSLQAAEQVRLAFIAFWRSLPMTALFYGALLGHVALALVALGQRHTLRMPLLEAVRIALGLVIPLLLAVHFSGTRMAQELAGLDDPYLRVVSAIWDNQRGGDQLLLMGIAWLHGCLGIHFVLRHKARYRQHFYVIFASMLLLPVLAALGFIAMAREIPVQIAAGALAAPAAPDAATAERLGEIADWIMQAFAALVAATLLLRIAREQRERRLGRQVTLTYPDRRVDVPRGWSVLEASRANGIPHLSMCGGRARCSTCRIRVAGDPAHLPAPSDAEQRTLRRIGAAPDVRLACQLRPTGDIALTPLLRARPDDRVGTGTEREVVVLFIDLRRWTTLSEQHLPHDMAYLLDQFFEVVGDAVRASGGVPNQFIGDSVMALFGLENDVAAACRQALDAAAAIEAGMARHNARMQQEFGQTFEFGIGIHAGPAAVGEVGWRDTRTFSAVGDAVNTAARLQELSKTFRVRLVVSESVVHHARIPMDALQRHEVDVRGRSDPLVVYAVPSPGACAAEAARLAAR